MVPVLIPKDCFNGLAILTDKETRKMVGINQKNEYVFASMKDSKYHVSGSVLCFFLINDFLKLQDPVLIVYTCFSRNKDNIEIKKKSLIILRLCFGNIVFKISYQLKEE